MSTDEAFVLVGPEGQPRRPCVKCYWHRASDSSYQLDLCRHPEGQAWDPIVGFKPVSCLTARLGSLGVCGREGKLWRPIPARNRQWDPPDRLDNSGTVWFTIVLALLAITCMVAIYLMTGAHHG